MCDPDAELCPVWRETTRCARKQHRCLGCRELIEPGHSYNETRSIFDGRWSTWKHCARCWALLQAISTETRKRSGSYVVSIDPQFACGETWIENFGPPPQNIEKLAFMLQGERVEDE